MYKTDSFVGNKKSSLNQNVWGDHATMQQDVLLHFLVIFLYWNQAEIRKKNILLSSFRAFSLSTPMENKWFASKQKSFRIVASMQVDICMHGESHVQCILLFYATTKKATNQMASRVAVHCAEPIKKDLGTYHTGQ